MYCWQVLIHGKLLWHASSAHGNGSQPEGFYCNRFVIADDEATARQLAYARVRADWDKDGRWTDDRSATLTLEAEEVYQVSMDLLREPVQGYVFYDKA